MSAKINKNWMVELAAGNSRLGPEISEQLYQKIKELPISDCLNCVLRGDLLKKWKRTQPLVSRRRNEDQNEKESQNGEPKRATSLKPSGKLYSSQSKGKSHERFFWVSYVCDTWFLRWQSRRKRSSESVFPLCKLEVIARSDEVTYYDSKFTLDRKQTFLISGSVTLQLAASTEHEALMWIAGIFYIAKHAGNEYAKNWLTNYENIAPYFSSNDERIPDFKSSKLKSELEKTRNVVQVGRSKQNRNKGTDVAQEENFQWPSTIYGMVCMFQVMEVISKPEIVEPIRSAITKLLDYREMSSSKLIELLSTGKRHFNSKKVLMKECEKHLETLNVACMYFKNDLIVLDPWLTEEECMAMFFNVVRQHALKIILSAETSDEVLPQEYEKFLTNVQAASKTEVTWNVLEAHKSKLPFTRVMKENERVRVHCFRKVVKPRVPVRVLTLLGFHWALAQKFNSICMPMDAVEIRNMLKYPLGMFWIASSHNTYLIGDQLGGSATAGALADALLRGCRCIELDCQDGSNGEPILCHSWKNCQLTGSVTLRDALIACREAAFVSSRLPVILSFEMHCSDSGKDKVVGLIKDILGKHLLVLSEEDPVDLVTTLPLGSLLDKILIKGKFKSSEDRVIGLGETKWQSILTIRGYPIEEVSMDKCKSNNIYAISENKFLKMTKDAELLKQLSTKSLVRVYPAATRLASTNFCPLKVWSLGVQFAALNYQSCDRSMLLNLARFHQSFGYVLKPPELREMNENENLDFFHLAPIKLRVHVLSASQLPSIASFDQKNFANSVSNTLLSIKQGGKPVDIDNFWDPKTKAFGMRHNEDPNKGLTRSEKREIKAAKSVGLMVQGDDQEDNLDDILASSAKVTREYSDKLCPFVEVCVSGENEKVFKTEAVNFNGFNPVWSDLTPPFEFTVNDPNQAIVTFCVKHFDNLSTELIGQAAFPVNRIRPGLRWVNLMDSRLLEIECCGLLVHVDMEYIT
ncbi:phosphatidylinositol-specific phospholipase C, putative [Theileria equi strain WA]|uniref:Phosphoinositide phospholipase C n=1 Tax=Theileria equi strain WA TaxID=1537102 RepID=L1LF95_THEEQ|nr:phosphatidylinositol-specific phospholipase C, putative [Theileria equi strain WA]EKX73818.1 phosphatidylinositol-specific phospholipase C, putative [Theileria equi strain WA]|eukprot:XP_004833270.1 phosphatidylinositol-specific phospholipase C, putative [Theileria equi strain WA]